VWWRRLAEFDGQSWRQAFSRPCQHRRRDIEAKDMAGTADRFAKLDRGSAAAAADIDHPLPRLDGGARQRRCGNGAQHDVPHFLKLDPVRPPGPFQNSTCSALRSSAFMRSSNRFFLRTDGC